MIEPKKLTEIGKIDRWIRFCLIALISAVSTNALATDYFWVGNSGNWNDNSHWSLSSGGNGGAGVPTINDNVYFDANSFTINSLVQIDGVANCKDFIWDGTSSKNEIAGAGLLTIKGSFVVEDQVSNKFTGDILLTANSGQKIIKAGKFQWKSNVIIDGGATFQLEDNFGNLKSSSIILRKGTLNTNGFIVYTGSFKTETNKNKNILLGTSTIKIFKEWNVEGGSNTSIDASNATIEYLESIPQHMMKEGPYLYGSLTPKALCPTPIPIDFTVVLTLNAFGNAITCNGNCDAELVITVNAGGGGPYGYGYDDGNGELPSLTNVITGLCADTYNVTVYDTSQLIFGTVYESCTEFGVVISAPAPIGINVQGFQDPTCPTSCDGIIFTSIGGGTGALAIEWPTIAPFPFIGEDPTNACTGTHTVNVIDELGCSFTADVTVSDPPPIAANLTIYPVSCNNVCDGSIMANPSGGNGGPYTYVWDGGLTPNSDSATGLCENITYNVVISDVDGCTQSASGTIPDRIPITITPVTPVNPTCFGLCNGEYSLLISGGSGTYTSVDWAIGTLGSGGTPFVPTGALGTTNLCANTNYIVYVTDDQGCQDSIQLPMLSQPAELIITETHTDLLCNGDGDGAIDITTVGGTAIVPAPAYTYQWTVLVPGGGEVPTAEDQNTLVGGDYQVVATDAQACTDTLAITIIEPDQIYANGLTIDNACYDSLNASINQSVTGGMGPGVYTFTWVSSAVGFVDPGTEDLMNLDSGTYMVTIVDTNMCSYDTTYTIITPGEIFVNGVPTAVLCNGGNTGSIDITPVNGVGTYVFDWSHLAPAGYIDPEDVTGLAQGSYTVSIRDDNGCVKDSIIVVNQPLGVSFTETHTDITCFGVADGTITLTISGGSTPYTTVWAGTNPMAIGNNVLNPTGLIAGTYDVTVTDNNGCAASLSIVINEPTEIILTLAITDLTCAGIPDGAIDLSVVGGSGGYTYDWDNNGTGAYTDPQDLSLLSTGMYCVSVRDNMGCQKDSCQIPVVEPDSIFFGNTVVTQVLCFGASTGAIDIAPQGGTTPPGYVFSWTSFPAGYISNFEDITGLAPMTYTVVAQDVNGCTNDTTITLLAPTQITAVMSSIDASCGASNGSVTATISGGAGDQSFSWTGPGGPYTGNPLTGLAAGTYDLTYTDLNGCTYTDQAIVNDVSAPIATFTPQNLSCFQSCDGSITTVITGGALPYNSVVWTSTVAGFVDPGTASLFAICAGDYTLTITDANSCIFSQTLTITEPDPIVAGNVVVSDVLCFSDSTGAIDLTPAGGTGAYSYNWVGPGFTANTQDVSNIPQGTYCVRITDINSCFLDTCVDVAEPTELTLAFTSNPAQCTLTDGDATVTPIGGTLNYSYLWPSTNTNATESNLGGGTYMVIVTDGNLCQDSILVTVSEGNGPTIVVDVFSDATCNGACDGDIQTTVTGANPFTLAWTSVPAGYTSASDDITALCAQTYILTATDDVTGCQVIENIVIAEPAVYNVPGTVVDAACFGGTGSVTLAPVGGTAPYNFNWDNDGTNDPNNDPQNLTNVVAGTYNVIGYDINGCTTNGIFTINEPTEITSATSNTPTSVCGLSDGSVTVAAANGTPGVLPNDYTYLWTEASTGVNVGNTSTVNNLLAGCYNVAITDGAGCTVQASECITDGGTAPLVVVPINVTCFGANDGIINVTLAGQDSLVWTGPQVIADDTNPATGLITGAYTATLTDNGCISATTVDVLEPLQITLTETLTNPPCAGASTGSINLVINDAIGATGIVWTGPTGIPNNANPATGLSAGVYTATVTDVNGCSAIGNYELFDNPSITLVTANVPTSCTVNTGEVSVVASGGVVAVDYTYSWVDGASLNVGTTATVTGLGVDTYTVTVTDDLGCTATASESVINMNGPTVTLTSVTNVSCFGANDGGIFINVTGGTLPYDYDWDNNGAGFGDPEDLSPEGSGTYSVIVSDGAGCTTLLTDVITEPAVLTVTGSVNTDLTCNGNNSGAIDITVAGGTLPFTFSWTDQVPQVFSTNEDVNGLSGGTYDVVVTDGNNCTTTYSATLAEPTALTITSGALNSTCLLSDGAVSVAGTGGTGVYTYNWEDVLNPGVSLGVNDTLFNLPAGSYEGFVTDVNGCTGSLIVSVTDATGPTATSAVTNVVCFGNSNGAIDLTVTESPLTYVWTGPAPFVDPGTEDIAAVEGGTYTVLITNSTGCSSSYVIVVGGPTGALATTVITTDLTCYDDGSGALDITTTGGTPSLVTGYTYAWTGPNGFVSTFEDITALDSGAYSLTVTDSNVCNYTVTYNITQPDSLAINAIAVDATCGLADGSITTAVTGGDGNYTYLWTGLVPGNNTSENGLGAGVYEIIVTDGNGCTTTENVPISDANAAPLTTIVTNVTCNGNGDGAIDLTVNGPNTYTYVWTGTAPYAGDVTEDISGLDPGTYNVLVTDVTLGCISAATINVTEPQVLAVTGTSNNVSCFGLADADIDITVTGGTTIYTYAWTGPNGFTSIQEDITGLDIGVYQVTVTDFNGCQAVAQFTITQPNTMAVSAIIVDDPCFQGGNGSIDITATQGSSPYTYLWTYPDLTTSNNEDLSSLVAGTYNLSIFDANLCQKDTFFVVTESPQIIANVVVTDANCTFSDGSAISTTSGGTGGGYVYSWAPANPSTTNSIINVPSGVYPLQIIDANMCQFDTTITINDVGGPTITVVNTIDVSCFGSSDGGVDMTVAGGAAPYTYLWNPNAISQAEDLFNAPADVYTYQVTDATGCNSFETVTIGSPAELTGTYTSVDATCGLCNGEATITAIGGTGTYSYIWSDNQITVTATNLCAGVQTVQITDANNCVSNVDVAVSSVGGPTGETIVTTDATCSGGVDGTASVTPVGGTTPYTYFWPHNGSTANPILNLAADNYFVEISDANGCLRVAEVIISEATVMTATAQVTPSICGGSDGAIATTTTGGSGVYTYSWAGGLSSISGQPEGVYTVTIDDGNCSITEVYTIPGSGAPELTLTETNTNCFNGTDGSITSVVSNNVGLMTYQWYNGSTTIVGETNTSINNLQPGTYILEGLDAGTGCTAYATVEITAPDSIVLSIPTVVDVSCFGVCDGEANAIASGGTLPFAYSWTGNVATTPNATSLCVGADTVIVTDANNCIVSSEIIVNEPFAVSVVIDSITDAFCVNSMDGAIFITANGGDGNYTYSWTSIPTGFADPGTDDINGLLPMSYVLSIVDGNNCTYSDTIAVDTLNILIADAGIDSSVCAGSCINLIGTGSGTSTFTLEWFEMINGTSVATSDTFLLCPTTAGTEMYVLVATDASCTSSDTVNVLVNPLPIVDAGIDYVEIYGTVVVLGGSPTATSGTYQWSPTINFTNPTGTNANPEVSIFSNEQYVVTVTDSNGCVNSDTTSIEIFPEIDFPNGFSPNGDGINDTWQIDNMVQFPDGVVEVYNRWGQQLFISVGYVQEFDGTHKGKDLPVGTYYYIITLNHPAYPDVLTGPITIMR